MYQNLDENLISQKVHRFSSNFKVKDVYCNIIIRLFSIQKPLLPLGIFGAIALSGLAFTLSLKQESRIYSLESMQNTLSTLKSRQDSLCSSVSKSEIQF